MHVDAIPAGLAPPAGTPEFVDLFGRTKQVIALYLGERHALEDPRRGVRVVGVTA